MKITEPSEDKQEKEPTLPITKTQSEREKLQSMTPKDRVWYIWEYYKFPILGILGGLFLLYGIATTIYRSSFETVFHCIYLNQRSQSELNTLPLEQDFAQYLALGAKETITSESIFLTLGEQNSELGYASLAKISALVAAKDLDAVIGDQESLAYYAALSGCLDLEILLPTDLSLMLKDRLIFAAGDDGVSRAYGIDLSGTTFAADSQLTHSATYLFFLNNSEHTDIAVALLRYIFAP